MTSALLKELLYCFACLSAFLLLGVFLRAKVKFFQKTFLPASVIGGFIGLLLGPIVLGNYAVFRIPQEWLKTFALLPGILIVPVVAAVPLGLKFGSKGGKGGDKGKGVKTVITMFLVMGTVGMLQGIVGFGTNVVFSKISPQLNIYESFGWELNAGFAGGHGTAGIIGNMLHSMNIPYWETAQGVAVTCATVGILGGIIMGMILINRAARKGDTALLKDPSDIPHEIKVGYQKDVDKQSSMGRETTMSSSIDTFALHASIVLLGCGIAYLILNTLKAYKVPILSSIAVWAYAILVMFGIWALMCKLNLQWMVDSKVKSKFAGTLTEFAITAAIISLPVKAVLAYAVPLVVMLVLGLGVTVIAATYLSKKFFKDYWFERSMTVLGMNTGVFLTGLLLLRICDPEYELPVLADYSIAYSFVSVIGFALFPIMQGLIFTKGALSVVLLNLSLAVVYTVLLLLINRKTKVGANN